MRQLRAAVASEPLPPGLRTRCEALARERSATALARFGPWWRVRLVPVLLSVVVIIFGASAFFSIVTRHSDALLAAQLTADHSKCFRLFGPPDGTAADARNIERMLLEQYRLEDPRALVSADDDVQLVGARRCLYADGLVPHVMYACTVRMCRCSCWTAQREQPMIW